MLVYAAAESNTLVCISQVHHAQLSARLAAAWPRRFSDGFIEAVARHDDAWIGPDAQAKTDEEGIPVDFVHYPLREKLAFYRRGITALAQLDPYIGYLISAHYTSFSGTTDLDRFQAEEADRREHLLPALHAAGYEEPQLEADLAWLRWFDLMSLLLCLSGPNVATPQPKWLQPETFPTSPDGTNVEFCWQSEAELFLRVDGITQPKRVALTVWHWLIPPEAQSADHEVASLLNQLPAPLPLAVVLQPST